MTNAQYFSQQLGFAPSTNQVEAAMIDNDLTGSDTYVKANMLTLKTAALSTLAILLSTPDVWQGTSETQNKVSYDRDAILKRIARLEDELGLTPLKVISSPRIW